VRGRRQFKFDCSSHRCRVYFSRPELIPYKVWCGSSLDTGVAASRLHPERDLVAVFSAGAFPTFNVVLMIGQILVQIMGAFAFYKARLGE
jgi:hypothetical protein